MISSGDDKLMAVSQSIDGIQAGEANAVLCPYCGGITLYGGKLCCVVLAKAMTALADARDKFRSKVN